MSEQQHRVLIVGGGGREHALAWKVAASPRVASVHVAPGNAGTAGEPGVHNVAIAADDIPALLAFARDQAITLTLVGPETPLAAGIVDRFAAAGLACFGPTQAAAQLEASKAFSKNFLARHEIPTAQYAVFADYGQAAAYIRSQPLPLVIKADGLAAGKGVFIAHSVAEALTAARAMLEEQRFGASGARIVVEAYLQGEEASFIVLVDGEHVLPLASSQDHKAAHDGDRGPNTGGMGAYSPAPVVTAAVIERVMTSIIQPTVAGMAAEGRPLTGVLYAGLMIADGNPQVLEFNTRFGDPETQPLMLRLESDLVPLVEAALAGRLDRCEARWHKQAALGVVMAAAGYPDTCRKGDVITDAASASSTDVHVFHAGTSVAGDEIITSGGRVLCVCALGDTVAAAADQAYARAAGIHWPGAWYRRDIGHRAMHREKI